MKIQASVLLLFALIPGLPGVRADDQHSPWQSDYARARALARAADRPLFVVFRCLH
jgi:hypothetical protein